MAIDVSPKHILVLIEAEASAIRHRVGGWEEVAKADLRASVDWLRHLVEHLPDDAKPAAPPIVAPVTANPDQAHVAAGAEVSIAPTADPADKQANVAAAAAMTGLPA